jgi:uncharacterized membrane protein YkvI
MRLSVKKSEQTKKYITVVACFGALVASRVGFTDLVRILFSIIGYAGLLLIGSLLYRNLKDKNTSLVPQFLYRISNNHNDRLIEEREKEEDKK